MEEEWIPVIKKRKQQGHPAGPTSNPTSPQRPQTPPKPAKKSKATDKSQPKKSTSQPPPQADIAEIICNCPPPPSVPIPKIPTVKTTLKRRTFRQFKLPKQSPPPEPCTSFTGQGPTGSHSGSQGEHHDCPARCACQKGPEGETVIRQRFWEGGRRGGQKDHPVSRFTSGQSHPHPKICSAAQPQPKRTAYSSHSGSSAASTKAKVPRHKIFQFLHKQTAPIWRSKINPLMSIIRYWNLLQSILDSALMITLNHQPFFKKFDPWNMISY